MKTYYRSGMCADITEKNIGQNVKLCGWVQNRRDLGGVVFIDLRDRTGVVQLVFNEENDAEALKVADGLRNEYVIQTEGEVVKRDPANYNDNISTGTIEVICSQVKILDSAKTPPIYVDDSDTSKESVRLKYRYLDLRKNKMHNSMVTRHKVAKYIRNFLDDSEFVEVETPFLTKPTPEGARSFLVPSRVQKGNFFALPQSPQLFKQILMVSGFDRYYQIVKCFRDEDLRQDRQPEFTQVDIEMSFVDEDDVININEKMIAGLFKEMLDVDVALPLKRMTYVDAMNRFGSDKPDLRFGLELKDIKKAVENSEFKVFADNIKNGGDVRAINAEGCGDIFSRREIDALVDFVKIYKAKGLAWLKVTDEGVKSPIEKFLTDQEVNDILVATDAKPGDLILIVADKQNIVWDALGQLRLEIARKLELDLKGKYEFVWITDFPLLEYDEDEKRYVAIHHPFTSPKPEDIELLDTDPLKARARAYDIVLNGAEIGGGSIRIHNNELQEKLFKVLGFSEEKASENFGFLLESFKYGTPPHGGIAYGLDRIVMEILGTDNIRDVIAFPKTQNHSCPMTMAPDVAEEARLEELGLILKKL
ncbi:aspartate--tRNA ligase [Alkalibacter saccharofermentans]|uniref:Aspartate--tRNA ligase n=1 Tax=Alkalibacter saccharofermentans DSM 14828 TaxID=1120975 RepID=A0A1M4S4C2_9FIRM|nr:aspartate--tRNA ligase [Alkalibacter saccharofermentans]SHE27066.1 aspartyl-tRNA synthetase [Alkalibacter saccharofermentans DSM 14828]